MKKIFLLTAFAVCAFAAAAFAAEPADVAYHCHGDNGYRHYDRYDYAGSNYDGHHQRRHCDGDGYCRW